MSDEKKTMEKLRTMLTLLSNFNSYADLDGADVVAIWCKYSNAERRWYEQDRILSFCSMKNELHEIFFFLFVF